MAHCSKSDRRSSPNQTLSPQAAPCPEAGSPLPCAQPSMHRYIHPIALSDPADRRETDRQSVLKALEEQNRLLTDLLATVNGLTALLCGRQDL